jgi:hypothetical protein
MGNYTHSLDAFLKWNLSCDIVRKRMEWFLQLLFPHNLNFFPSFHWPTKDTTIFSLTNVSGSVKLKHNLSEGEKDGTINRQRI